MTSNVGSQVSRYFNSKLTRQDFDTDFVFGAATSTYQIEGGYKDGGKSMSNWDIFSITQPGKISDGTNGCLAIDHFNKFKDDVKIMKRLGLDAYRFSISWARILPGGRLSAGVSREGIQYYSDLIDELLAHGIEPYPTLFHFDLPQCLQLEYGGFLSKKIVPDFLEYADVCFFEFGDRVKHWITLNEPWSFTHNGYVTGVFPPSRGSSPAEIGLRTFINTAPRYRTARGVDPTILGGDAGTEPYIVAHHLILAHAVAVDLYRKKYQVEGGQIGMTNMSTWYIPLTDTEEDIEAASRAVDFMWGWFLAPMVTGDYPAVMRERVGNRLPTFNPDETKLVKGSYDFVGLNYYTTNYAAYKATPAGTKPTYYTDQEVEFFTERDGIPIGEQAGSPWLFIYPEGFYLFLMHTAQTYNNPLIYITENGVDEKNNTSLTIPEARIDKTRVKYLQDHLAMIKKAITDGATVKAYFAWSLFDNYEWTEGYTVRFGMFYVDYVNGLARYPKNSAIWYMNFLKKKDISSSKRQVEEIDQEDENATKRIRRR